MDNASPPPDNTSCGDKGLDLHILFEPLEEQLDLPEILVGCRNRAGTEAVVVGQEQQYVPCVLADNFDMTQQVSALPLSAMLVKRS